MSTDSGPDLVVAGAGGGLVGALRAAQLGMDVLLVERSRHFAQGNNTAMSTAMVPGAGTRFQATAGIDDSAEIFLDDIMRKTRGQADQTVARALSGVSGRLVTWLADDLGLPLELVTEFGYPGHSRLRCHTVPGRSGRHLLDRLLPLLPDLGITLLNPARLTGVSCGPDGVTGVTLTYPDGSAEQVPTQAVLLATNGFGADRDLVARHIPEIAAATYHGSAESTGDALRIGAALGADTAFLDAYQGHAALALPAGTLAGWATVMHGAFLVDAAGRRFGDETIGYSEYAREVLAHAGGDAVIILDKRIHDACLAFDDFRDTVAQGALRWADTPRDLAAAVGVDPEGLAATMDGVARLATATAAAGRDGAGPDGAGPDGAGPDGAGADEFGRTHWEAPLRPPYAAVRVVPALFHTQGGLRVDGNARVLRPDRTAIAGLYAAGGAAMGISGHGAAGYLAGNGLLPALGLSFLAAEHAAQHAPDPTGRT